MVFMLRLMHPKTFTASKVISRLHYSRIHYMEEMYSTKEKGRTRARTDYTAPNPTTHMGRFTFRGEEKLLFNFLVQLFVPMSIRTQKGKKECLYIRLLFFSCTFHGPYLNIKRFTRKWEKKKFKILGLISQLFSRAIFYFSKQKKPENTYAN